MFRSCSDEIGQSSFLVSSRVIFLLNTKQKCLFLVLQVSPEDSAFDALSLARLGNVGGAGGGQGADDLQTIYGGSGGVGGGVGTETSSMRDSQSEYDVTVKCIVQCSQLFGEGVRRSRQAAPRHAGITAPRFCVSCLLLCPGVRARHGRRPGPFVFALLSVICYLPSVSVVPKPLSLARSLPFRHSFFAFGCLRVALLLPCRRQFRWRSSGGGSPPPRQPPE